MDSNHKAVLGLLKESGACLARQNGHQVWRLPDGKMFTTPSTPSDFREWKNALSVLRRCLGIVRDKKEPRVHDKRYTPHAPERETNYEFLVDISLPSLRDQLKKGEKQMEAYPSFGNQSAPRKHMGREIPPDRVDGWDNGCLISQGTCSGCNEEWFLTEGKRKSLEAKGHKCSLYCHSCREKIWNGPRIPVTRTEVTVGGTVVNVTKMVPIAPEPKAEPQAKSNPRRKGVALKRSSLSKLRSLPVKINAAQLSDILAVSSYTVHAWSRKGKLPSPGAGTKFDPNVVAEWLMKNHCTWEMEESDDIPSGTTGTGESPKVTGPVELMSVPAPAPATESLPVPLTANATDSLSDADLLWLAYAVLDTDNPNSTPRRGTAVPFWNGTAEPRGAQVDDWERRMISAKQTTQEESVAGLRRVRGRWSVSPLREAGTLLGVLKQQGLAGAGLVKAFEKWAPKIVGCSRTDMHRLYHEHTGRELSDYILIQKADKIVRYSQLPPEAEVFRQIILRTSKSADPKHDDERQVVTNRKSADGLRTLYKVRVEVKTAKGNHDGTVLLAALSGRKAAGRARSEIAAFFGVPAKAVKCVGAGEYALEDFLVIDGHVMEKDWLTTVAQ